MTKYKRITGKVFGGNATATGNDPQIAQFGSALAGTFIGTTDPETIQQLPAWGEGWSGAVTPETQFPPMPEMTGAMKVLSHQICGILQQGVSIWDSATIYYTGNFCSKNGAVYVSLTDENQGNDPESDTANWRSYGGANLDLSNLSSQGQNIANWSTNTTNCITEIPQNIKLELNDSVLTLKAGSKVIMPNGVNVFDEITIQNNVSQTWTFNGKGVVVYKSNTNTLMIVPFAQTSSGTTAPTVTTTFWLWHDTTNNKVKFTSNNGETWNDGWSLPVGLIVGTSSGITSIDKVFNGLGFIGGTIFANKGIKYLIPNGRNEDGTLKNLEVETTKVSTISITTSRADTYITLISNGVISISSILSSGLAYYDEEKNLFYQNASDKGGASCPVGIFNCSANGVDKFEPKYVFRAVDFNDALLKSDKAEIINWGIPDYSAIITNVGGSLGSAYTAPSDGYYIATIGKNDSGVFLTINGTQAYYYVDGQGVNGMVVLPFVALVGKGDVCEWNSGVDIKYSCFVPLKGAK